MGIEAPETSARACLPAGKNRANKCLTSTANGGGGRRGGVGGVGGTLEGWGGGGRWTTVAGPSASPFPLDRGSSWLWKVAPQFLEDCDSEFVG